MAQNAEDNLIELVETLNRIATSAERIAQNSSAMYDDCGGIIEF